jgi:hypothetical protein
MKMVARAVHSMSRRVKALEGPIHIQRIVILFLSRKISYFRMHPSTKRGMKSLLCIVSAAGRTSFFGCLEYDYDSSVGSFEFEGKRRATHKSNSYQL